MPDIKISNLDDVERLARLLVGSVFVPKDWNDKAPADQEKAVANTVGAILVAMSLGVPIIQGIRSISIIHGRPCMTAELMLAICMRQPDFEGIREWIEGSGEDAVAHCEIRRAKFGAIRRSFSMRDARRAGLADRDTWRKYPQRMLRARALAWACRDIYADVLCGLISAE
ncbi:MAG: hypothetical protein RML32_01110, partial [Gammaproteobacteria bacterium]|nr:hypothetical protein [Gammaproteobacteria bacterium]